MGWAIGVAFLSEASLTGIHPQDLLFSHSRPLCPSSLQHLRKAPPNLRGRVLWISTALHVLHLPLYDWWLHFSRLDAFGFYCVCLPQQELGASIAGGRSLTMIFSHGFGLRFDLLYALSMVCVSGRHRHKLIWPSLDWDAPRSMDCMLKSRDTCNWGFVWAFQYHHRNLRRSHADAFFKRQEEVWTYGSQLQWEDCPIDLTITLALCRL